MTCLLALETATDACSAAIWVDGSVAHEYRIIRRRHNGEILGMVDRVMAAAGVTRGQLDAVAVGLGPGSFTGLRIAVGVAQGIAYAVDVPAVPVSTLQAIAARAAREREIGRVLAVLDARRGEVYWAAYEDCQPLTRERASGAAQVVLPDAGEWCLCGPGAQDVEAFAQSVRARLTTVEPQLFPAAWDVAVLGAARLAKGEGVAADALEPLYLTSRGGWKTTDQQRDSNA